MLNRNEYITQLKKYLRKLPFDEIKEAVDYYEQYFDDAGEENEQAVIAELGTPSAVASQIIASFAVKDTGVSEKKGLTTAWMAILAVFASPVALPLALLVAVLALILVVVMGSIILSIGMTGAGLVLSGIAGIIVSVPILAQSIPTAILYFGVGLICSGIGLALIIWTVQLSKKSFNALAKKMGEFILRRNKK